MSVAGRWHKVLDIARRLGQWSKGSIISGKSSVDDRMAEMAARLQRMERQLAQLAAGQTIYLGDHEALTRIYTGHRVYVDTRDIGICAHLMTEGRWEPWVESALAPLVKPGMHVIDAGANFGYYTLLMNFWIGAAGRLESIEANPAIWAKLRKSVAINGFASRTRVHQVALLDIEGSVEFTFAEEFSGGGHIGRSGDRSWTVDTTSVPATTMDTLLADVPAVQVIKMDIEGSEALALRGGKKLLDRSRSLAMIMEFHAPSFVRSGDPPGEFLARWAADGFELCVVEPAGVSAPMSPEQIVSHVGDRLAYLRLVRGD